jgi:predicted dehydrogenase
MAPNPKRVRAAVIGTGFMGRVHLEALRRIPNVDVVAIAGSSLEKACALGAGYGIANATGDWRQIMANPDVDAVHITTPNDLHFPMAETAFEAGKHVLCEKPLALSVEEARSLTKLQEEKKLRGALCHNLRYYPMVQEIRAMREAGELGDILVVQGTYSQDWMLYDSDWNWRVDPVLGGSSRVMADIGSHFFDMVEHLTGLKVRSLCSDWQIFHPTRKRPLSGGETFSGKSKPAADSVEVKVETEDFGATLFRLGQHARGAMTASQVSAGRKNGLAVEIYGTKASAAWCQEKPEELWIGHRDAPNQLLLKDPALMHAAARGATDLPGGHAEGYYDTFKQIFRLFYASIADPDAPANYPEMADGLRQMNILAAEQESSRRHAWVDVAD